MFETISTIQPDLVLNSCAFEYKVEFFCFIILTITYSLTNKESESNSMG